MKTVKLRLNIDFKNDTGLFLRFTSKCLLAARECIVEIQYCDKPEMHILYGYIKLTFDERSQVYLNSMIQEVING